MRFPSWLRSIIRPEEKTRTMPCRRARRKNLRITLSLEMLEDRTLLSPYLVTTTADAGAGSLRDAITQINADTSHSQYPSPSDPTKDEIDFNIPTSDPGYNSGTASFTIQPTAVPSPTFDFTGLPLVTNSVIIDGYTQPGASPNTLTGGDNAALKIELNGANAGALSGIGLVLDAPNCTVEGLAINGFGAYAVWTLADGVIISGNFIGTDVTGTAAVPNSTSTTGQIYHPGPSFNPDGQNGAIQVYGNNNVIGGTAAAARNVISGNDADGIVITGFGADGIFLAPATGTDVMGNFIGTDASGTQPLGNASDGIGVFGQDTTIGGTTAGARNIISANTGTQYLGENGFAGNGVYTGGDSGTVVEGNYVGTDVSGTKALGNENCGVGIGFASNDTLGGTAPGAGNLISGNLAYGVAIGASQSCQVEGNLIGTDFTGTAPLGNREGVFDAGNTGLVIGGTDPDARNVISGNSIIGVDLRGTGAQVQGNYIGTDITGTFAIANGYGVYSADLAQDNTIGGLTNTPGTGAGNLISGNDFGVVFESGVMIGGTSDNIVEGNLIGTDRTGLAALPNAYGVRILDYAFSNTIGGTTPGSANVISGNTDDGVDIAGNFDILGATTVDPTGNQVLGNYIGTDMTGTVDLGNGTGVAIESGASSNTIGGTTSGAANTIAYNTGIGVAVTGNTSTGNSIRGNSIHGNGALGIDLGADGVTPNTPGGPHTGPNDLQNFAGIATEQVITGASTTVAGTLNSTPNTTFALDFFANPAAAGPMWQAQTYLGSTSVTTDGNGNVSFNVILAAATSAGEVITSTATDPNGNTSEIGSQLPLVAPVSGQTPVEGASTPINLGTLADLDNGPWTIDVNWGDASADTVFTAASTGALGTQNHTYAEEGPYTITVTATNNPFGLSRATTFNVAVSDPAVVGVGVPVLGFTGKLPNGTPLAVFADPGGPEALNDYSAQIHWGDSSSSSGSISVVGTVFTVTGSHTFSGAGPYTITITINHEGILTTLTTTASAGGNNAGLLLLDPSAQGALTDTGKGGVTVNGPIGTIIVDSSNSRAVTITGNGIVSAAFINDTGGVRTTGNGALLGTLTHPAPTPDPLHLSLPPAPTPTHAAVNYSGSMPLTLSPGTYVGGIKITGKGNVTLLPGIYYMQGGGFSVTGQGSVSGTGVLLVNAPSKSSDTISFTGQGNITLSAPASLTGANAAYSGIAILQDPASNASINVTGQGAVTLTGIVYAPKATLNITGNGGVNVSAEVILDDLNVTGNGGLTVNLTATGTSPADPVLAALTALAQGGSPLSQKMAQLLLSDDAAPSPSELTAYFAALGLSPTGASESLVETVLANPTSQNQELLFWALAGDVLEGGLSL